MAFHLSSCHSPIFHDHHPLYNSLSSSKNILQFTPSLLSFLPKPPFNKLNSLSSSSQPPRFSISSNLSVQDPVPQKSQYPDEEITSSAKKKIWVNPKSPRAAKFRQQSYDTRYSVLAKLAQSFDSCNSTETDIELILSSLGEKPLEQDAVIVIDNMKNHENAVLVLRNFLKKLKSKRDVILYNVTSKVFRKNGDLDGVEMLFDEMIENGIKPDNISFSTIISTARLCSHPEKALDWFEKMSKFGCEPDDVIKSAMIDVYGRLGNIDKALNLYEQAKKEKWRIDVVTFATVIKCYSTLGDFSKAFKVYEDMKVVGMKPNLNVYNLVLDAMGKAKRPWQVKTVANEMTKNGIVPSWPTYAALIRAYGKARHTEEALSVYREMKEKGLELNVILYNTLIAMCADIGCVDDAIEIFEELKKSGACQPDSWTYSSLIKVYSRSGNVSEVKRMLNEMSEAGFEPDIFVFTSLIQCYGKANRIDDVVRTVDRLQELSISPDDRFFGCLLNVLSQTPKEEIGKLVRCVETANPKLGYVVKQLVAGEDVDDDSVFKQEVTELIDTISADTKKAYFNFLIDLCVNLDRLDKAHELLELGLALEIYPAIQSKSSAQWSLNLRSLSLSAALTALHIWVSDLSKALDNGDELPPLLGINTGHGKNNSEKGLASGFAAHLRELNAPFHESPDRVGWFLTTNIAAVSWLESRKSPEPLAA